MALISPYEANMLLRNDPNAYFKLYNHMVPYREKNCVYDPFFKLFKVLADNFDAFFKSRNGVRFNLYGLEVNRKIVRDWDSMVYGLGARDTRDKSRGGFVGTSHPLQEHISGDMRSRFNIIWFEYDLALKIMALGYLP